MILNTFNDLLKRGNLPDDDRIVPNWMKIKNKQFENVNLSNNTVDEILKLTNNEFNQLVSSSESLFLLVYLSTLSHKELERFYIYADKIILSNESENLESSAKDVFKEGMESVKKENITIEQKIRATLEIPMMISFSKNLYHTHNHFTQIIRDDYYDFNNEYFMQYEGYLTKILWGEMKYIPDYYEQVLEQFKDFYDEENDEHKNFFAHLSKKFGVLIGTLSWFISITENRESSLSWFTQKSMEYGLMKEEVEISVSQSLTLEPNQKLINFTTLTFTAICQGNDDNYLSNLMYCVDSLFEYYPVNDKACEYALQEMMKSIALKEVNVENANMFLDFFENLPRFYEVLSYEKIMNLKEVILSNLEKYKPLDNKTFDEKDVKNKLILLNYKIDMEDLYYEGLKEDSKNV